MATQPAPQSLTIGRRTFRVESAQTPRGEPFFLLHGPRGAVYSALQLADRPGRFWVATASGHCPSGMGAVHLAVVDGSLRVAS